MKVDQILMEEYGRVRQEIFSIENRNDHVAGISMTLIGVLFIYGIQQSNKILFLVLPFLIYLVIFYVLYYYYTMHIRKGYLQVLEDEINKISGNNKLIWDTKIIPRFLYTRKSPVAIGCNAIAVLLAIGTIIYSHYIVHMNYPFIWFKVQLIISIIFFLWIIFSGIVTVNVSRKTYRYSKEYFNE